MRSNGTHFQLDGTAVSVWGQEQRTLRLQCEGDIGSDLLPRTVRYVESLGRPFRLDLEVLSPERYVDPREMIGQAMSLRMRSRSGDERHFHGIAAQAVLAGHSGYCFRYRIRVRPPLWFLTQSTNCRTFRGLSVTGIIREVLSQHGITDCRYLTSEELYPAREFAAQYRESDFNFVSRLMERAGLYYVHQHGDTRCELVIADSIARLASDPVELRYASQIAVDDPIGRVSSLRRALRFRPGRVALSDYNYEGPEEMLVERPHGAHACESGYEVFDGEGRFQTMEEAEQAARIRLEQIRIRSETLYASTSSQMLSPADTFTLTDYPAEALNDRDMLVTGMDLRASTREYDNVMGVTEGARSIMPTRNMVPADDHGARGSGWDEADECLLRLVPCWDAAGARIEYRSQPRANRPRIRGPQTALVVGDGSPDSIDAGRSMADALGRVRVRFYWDQSPRGTPEDEGVLESAPAVRVSEAWAGKGYGTQHIPHIGQEVIVEFINGDPDRPIITGRVYNGRNRPPLDLPAQAYKTVVAEDFAGNQLIFDATPDNEHILLHCPKSNTSVSLGGKSDDGGFWGKTTGNENSFTIGNKHEVNIGNSTEISLGSAIGLAGGFQAEAFVGATVELGASYGFTASVGGTFEFSYQNAVSVARGTSYEHSSVDEVSDAEEDIVKCATMSHDLGGLRSMTLAGGGGAPGLPMSVVKLTPTKATMTVGPAADGLAPAAAASSLATKTALAGMIAGVLAGGTGILLSSAAMKWVTQPEDNPNTPETEGSYDGANWQAKALWGSAAALGAGFLASVAASMVMTRAMVTSSKSKMSREVTPGEIPKVELTPTYGKLAFGIDKKFMVTSGNASMACATNKIDVTPAGMVLQAGAAKLQLTPALLSMQAPMINCG